MADLWSRLLLALLFSFFACSTSLVCPGGKPLPPDSCVQLFSTNSSQSEVCGDFADGPVQFTAASQFYILSRYAQVVGTEGRFYWLGYQFASSDTLLGDVDSEISTVLLNVSNYGSMELQEAAGEGACLAMGQDGLLYRRMCETQLPGFCYERFERPSATLSIRNSDRFVEVGSGVQLNCTVSEGSTLTWVASRAGTRDPEVIDPPDITSFSDDDAGAYYCVANNSLGTFVSDPIVLVVGHTMLDRNQTAPEVIAMTSQPAVAQFGLDLTLMCDFSSDLPVTNINWFVNGRPMRETSGVDQMSTSLRVVNLQKNGFYQCFVRTEIGNVASASMLIQAEFGVPSEVDEISALPDNQTSIIVTWLCPVNPNTIDLALLRYRVFYQQGFQVSTTSGEASTMDNILPTLATGEESSDCLVEAVLPNLMMGTTYAVKVVAVSPGGTMGEVADAFAVTTTFGKVPGLVEGLTVQRTEDNKTVHAMWEDLKTTLPVGVVARYRIEYRDNEKNSVSTVFHQAKYNFLVVTNVINANTYEVRVSAGTVVRRKPLKFEFGAFTNWTEVRGISNNVPSTIPPTVGPLRTQPAAGALAAGVTVGVLSLIVTLAILIAGLVCYLHKRGSRGTYSPSPDSVKYGDVRKSGEAEDETELSKQ